MILSFRSEKLKIFTLAITLGVAFTLTYYFHFILGEGIIFTHFYYIPIILATLWWKRKGLIVPVILSALLLTSHYISGLASPIYDDLFRSMMFLILGAIVAILSEEMASKEKKKEESEEKFRSVAQTAVDGIITVDGKGRIVYVNDSVQKIFGYLKEQLIGEEAAILVIEKYRSKIREILDNRPAKDQHRLLGRTLETTGIRADGGKFPLEVSISAWNFSEKNYYTAILRDITQRKTMEEKKNELAAIVESSDDAIISRNMDGVVTSWNQGAERIYGYSEKEALGNNMDTMYAPRHEEEFSKLMEQIIKGERVKHYETQRVRKDGEIIDISLTISPLRNADGEIIGSSAIARDITEKKQMEKDLQQSLKDKDMLIGEIHHRVKNNLIIITSLLSLQSDYVKDQESRSLFEESENRARSMALIHEKLYQSGEAKRIDFNEYIQSLGKELYQSYALNTNLHLETDLDPDIFLDVDTAIPLGLIFNELFTNSLKHAFPEGGEGTIKVGFHKLEGDEYQLTLEDDGVGLSEDFNMEESESFGLRLVDALTQQIDAKVKLDTSNGTSYTITFQEKGV